MADLNDVVRHVILKIVVDQAGLGAELAAARAKLKGLQDLENQHGADRDKSEQDFANKQAKNDQDLKQRLLDAQSKRRDAHKERMQQLEEEGKKLKANTELAEERARNARLGGQTQRANQRNQSQAQVDATNARRDATTRDSEARAETAAARTEAIERESLAKTKATNQKRLDNHKAMLGKIEQAEQAHAIKLQGIQAKQDQAQAKADQDLYQRLLDQRAKRRDALKEYRARDSRRQATLQPTIDTDLLKLDKARETATQQASAATSRAERAKNAVLQDQEKHRSRIAILANQEAIAEQKALQIAEQRALAFQREERAAQNRRRSSSLGDAFHEIGGKTQTGLRQLDDVRLRRKELREEYRLAGRDAGQEGERISTGFLSALGRGFKKGNKLFGAEAELKKFFRRVGDDAALSGGSGGGGNFFKNIFSSVGDLGKNLEGKLGGAFRTMLSFRGLIIAVVAVLGPLAAILGAVGAAALALASDVGALVGSMAALPGLIGAAVAGFGAMYIALQPLGDAFSAFTAKNKAASTALAEGGKAARDAARALVDARRELQDAETESERAQQDLPRSQGKLNDAYKDAARRIQDYRLALQKLRFDQEGADLGVEGAQAAYRRALADPTATNLDRKQALHNAEGALFDRRDQKVASGRLIEDAAEAEAKGVAGSDEVIDAQRGVEDAFRRVADAATRLTRAQEDLTEAQKDSDAGGSALRKAADELEAALGKLHPSARKVVEALQALDGAYKDMQKRLQGRIFKDLSKDTGLFKDGLKELESFIGPAADAIGVLADNALKLFTNPEWKAFFSSQGEENGKILSGLGQAALDFAEGLKDIIVLARPLTQFIVDGIGGMAKKFQDFTQSRTGREEITTFFDTVMRTMKELGPIVGGLFKGIGGFFKALNQGGADGKSFTTKFNEGLLGIVNKFVELSNKAQDPKGGFQKWLRDVGPLLKGVAGFLGDVGRFFGNLFSNPKNIQEAENLLRTIGQKWLPAIAAIFDKLSESGFLSKLAKAVGTVFQSIQFFMEHGGVEALSAFGSALQFVATTFDRFLHLIDKLGLLTPVVKGFGAVFAGLLAAGLLVAIGRATGLFTIFKALFAIAKPLVSGIANIGKGFGDSRKEGRSRKRSILGGLSAGFDEFTEKALGRDKEEKAAAAAARNSERIAARGGTPPDMTNKGGMLPTVYRIEVHTKVMAGLLKQIAVDVNTIRLNRGGTGSNPNAPGRKFGGGRVRNSNRNQGASNVLPNLPGSAHPGSANVGLHNAGKTTGEIAALDTNLGKLATQFKSTGGAKDLFIKELRDLSREFGKLGGAGKDAGRLAANLQKLVAPLEALKNASSGKGLGSVVGDIARFDKNLESLSRQFGQTSTAKDQFIGNLKLLASQFERTHAASDRYSTQLGRQARQFDDPAGSGGTYLGQGRASVPGSQVDPDDPANQPKNKPSRKSNAGRTVFNNRGRGGRKSRKAIGSAFQQARDDLNRYFGSGKHAADGPDDEGAVRNPFYRGPEEYSGGHRDPDEGRQKKVSKAEKEAHKLNNRIDEDARVSSGGGGTFGRFQQFLGDRRLRNQREEDRPPYATATADDEQRKTDRRRGFLGEKYVASQGRGDEGSIDFGFDRLNGRFLGIPLPGAENARKRQTSRDLNAARERVRGLSGSALTDYRWGQGYAAVDRREARQDQAALRKAGREGFISPYYEYNDDGRQQMMLPASLTDEQGRRRFLQQQAIPGVGDGGPRDTSGWFAPQPQQPVSPRREATTGFQPIIPGTGGGPLRVNPTTQEQAEKRKGQRKFAEIRRKARLDPDGLASPSEPGDSYYNRTTNLQQAARLAEVRKRERPDVSPDALNSWTTEEHPHLTYEQHQDYTGWGADDKSIRAYQRDENGDREQVSRLQYHDDGEVAMIHTNDRKQERTGIMSNAFKFGRSVDDIAHSNNLLPAGQKFARKNGGDFMEAGTIERLNQSRGPGDPELTPENSGEYGGGGNGGGYGYDDSDKDDEGYSHNTGYNADGFDRSGYNAYGEDEEGYNQDGKDYHGYSREGYDRDGKDPRGLSREGWDYHGKDAEGYSRGGRDYHGYDRDNRDRRGYDPEGYDENGFRRDGTATLPGMSNQYQDGSDESNRRRRQGEDYYQQVNQAQNRAGDFEQQNPGQRTLTDRDGRIPTTPPLYADYPKRLSYTRDHPSSEYLRFQAGERSADPIGKQQGPWQGDRGSMQIGPTNGRFLGIPLPGQGNRVRRDEERAYRENARRTNRTAKQARKIGRLPLQNPMSAFDAARERSRGIPDGQKRDYRRGLQLQANDRRFYRGTEREEESLRRRLSTGVATETPLNGGAMAETVRQDLNDGSQAVRKKARTRRDADNEELGAWTGRAFGLPTIPTVRTGDTEVSMDYRRGRHASWPEAVDLVKSDHGLLMGAMDQATRNADRHKGNYLVDDGPLSANPRITPIDHGNSFGTGLTDDQLGTPVTKPIVASDPFTKLFRNDYRPGQDFDYAPNDLSKNDAATIQKRFDTLQPKYDALGYAGQHATTSARIAELAKHATGTVDRVAPPADAASYRRFTTTQPESAKQSRLSRLRQRFANRGDEGSIQLGPTNGRFLGIPLPGQSNAAIRQDRKADRDLEKFARGRGNQPFEAGIDSPVAQFAKPQAQVQRESEEFETRRRANYFADYAGSERSFSANAEKREQATAFSRIVGPDSYAAQLKQNRRDEGAELNTRRQLQEGSGLTPDPNPSLLQSFKRWRGDRGKVRDLRKETSAGQPSAISRVSSRLRRPRGDGGFIGTAPMQSPFRQRGGGQAASNLGQSLLFDAQDLASGGGDPASIGFAATSLFADIAGGAQDIRDERQQLQGDDEPTARRRRTAGGRGRKRGRGRGRGRTTTRRPVGRATAGDGAGYEEGYEDGYDDASGGAGQQLPDVDLPDRDDDDRHPNRRNQAGEDEDRPKSRSERRAERRSARREGGGRHRLAGRGGGRGGRLGNFLRGGGRGARFGGGGLLRGAGGGLLRGAAGGIGGLVAGAALQFGGQAAIDNYVKDDDDAGSLTRGLGAVSTGAGIGATIGSVIPGVGTVIGGAIGGLAGGAYSLYKDKNLRSFVGGKISGGVKAVGGALGKAGSAIGGFFSDTFGGEKADGTKKNFGERVGSILGGVTPIGALLKNTDIGKTILDGLSKAGGKIGDFFTKTIPDRFHKGVKTITDFFTVTLPSLPAKAFHAFFTGVGVIIGFFKYDLPRAATAAWHGITTFFTKTLPNAAKAAWRGITNFFTHTLPDAASAAWNGITTFFTQTLPQVAQQAWDGITNFFTNTLPQKAGQAWGFVKNRLFKPFARFITEDIPRFFTETIPNWFKAAPEKIKEHIVTPLTDFFTKKLPEFFTVTLPNAISKLPGKIKGAIVDPVVNFFTGIGDHIGDGFRAFKSWAGGLFASAGSDIQAGEDSRKQSGGLIEGIYQGVEDRVRVLATPGEFMVRRSRVEQPGAKAFLHDFNEGRVDPSQFYAALNQPPVMSMTPVPVSVPAAGMSTVNNTSTTNGGLTIGDITVNNPKPEKAGHSLRRQIQIQHMRHRL